MVIQPSNKIYNKKKAIIEIILDNYTIYIFQGELSKFDILIRYNKENKRLRTPKHIHWVVDVLMKLQANKQLTHNFLEHIKLCWNKTIPLSNNDYQTLKESIIKEENQINLNEYLELNKYGEFNVEFLFLLMILLAIQEKTNRNDAYMFGNILAALLEEKLDIYKIVSTAGFNKRR